MKKEASKKSKLWIWLVAGIVLLLAVVGVVLALVLGGGGEKTPDGPQGGRADLYWNIDKAIYTADSLSGLSTREPGEDGAYHVRFAYNGQQVELAVADKQLVNYIDTLDCMGVVLDADGMLIDVVDPKTLATETARMFYVRSVEADKIVLNSSMAMNGMSMDIPVADVTEIYDVAPTAEVVGQIMQHTELKAMDCVTVYSNDLAEATHVYVVSHPVESPVYWRADTGKYSSTTKATTREPDAEGYYTIPFYVNGEYVELKCNNQGIVNTIDAKNRFKAHTGLVLDENGYIVDNMLAATGIRGLLGCEMYDIIELSGNSFTAEALLAANGDTYSNTITEETVIYDVSLAAKPEVRGKAITELKLGDRIAVFENTEGEAVLIFVAHRLVDSPMYFNVTKKYNSTNKTTTRTPDGDGWYTIEMMSDGVIKTYKTKDKALIDKIDSQNNRSVGLELDGDVITYVWEGECVAGYGAYVGYTVQTVTGSILSITPSTDPEAVRNVILNTEAKVYNMSGVKQEKGELTTLEPGDYCIMWRNPRSEIVYAYVIRRLVDAPVYFSLTRKWDGTKESTTRVPDADGYYVYECIKLGQKDPVTVKTKSKKVADFLDSQSPQTFALKVNAQGVIYENYETAAVYGGNKAYLNNIVKRLDVLVTYYPVTEKVNTPKLAENVKIYNMSAAFERYKGEPTTLKLDDSIQCYTNAKGEIALILVRIRKVDADIYFSEERVKTVDANGHTTRKPDADGWYVFKCAKDGKEVTVKTKDIDIATFMDAQSPQSFALIVDKNGVVQKAYPTTAATGGSTRAVNAVVQSVDGGKIVVKLTNGTLFEMPMAKSYKVYDVSGEHEKNFGEPTKIKVGDTLQSYTNSDNKVSIVFVKTRSGQLQMAWNIDPQYKVVQVEENGELKDEKVTTRTPDAEGLYSIELAVDGKISTYKVKGEDVINYIDKATGAIAITLKKGVIIEARAAIYGPGVWNNAAAAQIATINEIKDGVAKVTTYKGQDMDIVLNSQLACYDVSGKGEFKGVAATPTVGDYGRFYLNTEKEAVFFYIVKRVGGTVSDDTVWVMAYMAEDAQFDSTNLVTTRTPDADGYYYVKLAVNGEVKTYKTKQTGIDSTGNGICYADQSASRGRAFAIQLKEEGSLEFLHARSAINAPNSKKAGTNGTVAAIDGNTVTLTNSGTVTLAEGVQIYDVSSAAASFGEAAQLAVGDAYMSYANADGQLTYIYIKSRTAVDDEPDVPAGPVYDNSDLQLDADNKAKCTFCDEVVEWTALESISEATTLTEGVHYYLANDITDNTSYYAVTNNCVHLNGHNLTSTNRAFAVNNGSSNLLTVMGNGVVTGGYTSNATASVAGATISCRGNLNLIGGTYKHANSTLPTIIMAKPQQTMNIYEGVTIEGTEGVTGTNLYVMMGIVNMYGGTITGGTATPDGSTGGYGDNIYVHGWTGSAKARSEFNMFGGTVDGGIYATKTTDTFQVSVSGNAVINSTNGGLTLDSASGAVLTLGQLGSNAKIYVTGNGAITNETTYAADYVNTKILPASQEISLKAEGNVIIASEATVPVWVMAVAVDAQYDSTNKVTTRTPDADGYYFIDLSVNGEVKTYKTKQTGLDNAGNGIDYADQCAASNRPFAVQLTEEGSVEFLLAKSALNAPGVEKVGVSGKVTAIDGNTVSGTDANGNPYTAALADDVKIYDISATATVKGEAAQLAVGDGYRCYANAEGVVLYVYITNKVAAPVDPEPEELDMNTVKEAADAMASVFAEANDAAVEAECPVCGEAVTWNALPAPGNSSNYLESGHYYAQDREFTGGYYNVNNGAEVCVHLNGATLTNTTERVFYVDKGAVLTVMGSGNITGGRSASTAAFRCGSVLEVVGNTTNSTTVNLCGGTWSKSKDALDVVGVRCSTEGGLNIYEGTTINIGEVEGNALWVAGGNVNLSGGEINGDVLVKKYTTSATAYPINLVLGGTTVNGQVTFDTTNGTEIAVTLQGTAVIGELIANAEIPVQIGRLYAGADVKVTATGAFTAANPNAQDYVDDGFISAKAENKTLSVSEEGIISCVDAPAAQYDNSNLTFTEGTKAMCTYCGEEKTWTAIVPDGNGTQIDLAEGGHYYLENDLLNNTSAISSGVTNACVHLNGHKIETVDKSTFIVVLKKGLTIMGKGDVSSSGTAAATISSAGTLNLIGGTYSCAAATQPVINHIRSNYAISVYEDVTINGNDGVKGSAINFTYGNFNLYGGTINGNIYLHGNNGTTNVVSNFVIDGGVIDGGLQIAHASTASFLKLSGAPVITAKNGGLNYCNMITVERLTKGAEIYVTAADGAFTLENARAAAFLEYGYIKAADENKTVTENAGVLSIG